LYLGTRWPICIKPRRAILENGWDQAAGAAAGGLVGNGYHLIIIPFSWFF
jgi:hypothetical protein